MSKGRFLGPEKLQNHTNEGKGKEKKKGGEDKKAMVALLLVIWLLWRLLLAEKKTVGHKKMVHLGVTFSKIQLYVYMYACM